MAALVEFFFLTKTGRMILLVVALTAGALISWVSFKTHYYDQGYAAAISAVAAKNEEATHAVQGAKRKVDTCFAGGGTWNVTDGVCDK